MAARTAKLAITDRWKDQLRASMLHKKLTDHIDGKIDLEPTQVRSIELILQRCIPTLTATELTTVNESEKLDENQLLAKLEALIAAHPDLVQRALAAAAKRKAEGATLGATPHVSDTKAA